MLKPLEIQDLHPSDFAEFFSDVFSQTHELDDVDSYGNIISKHIENSIPSRGVVETTDVVTTFPPPSDDQLERWLIALPSERKVTSARGGETTTRTESFCFNNRGELTSVVREPGLEGVEAPDTDLDLVNRIFQRTTIGRDDFGNVSDVEEKGSDGEIRSAEVIYDDDNIYPRFIVNALSQSTEYKFDVRSGMLREQKDANGLIETWRYDNFDQLLSHNTPAGKSETWTYNVAAFDEGPSFNVPAVIAVNHSVNDGSFENIRSDALGRVVRKESSGLLGATVREDTEYDSAGRVGRVTRPYAGDTNTQGLIVNHYDAAGDLESQTLADGSTVEIHRASRRNVVTDAIPGDLLDEVNGIWIEQTVNERMNSDIRILDHNRDVVANVDARGNVTRYTYGPFDQLRQIEDSQGNATLIQYDLAGRVVNRTDPDAGEHTYRYTAFGEQRQHDDAEGNRERSYFDVLGRQFERINIDGTSTWSYDGPGPNAIGRLVAEATTNPGDTRSFDTRIEYSYESGATGRLESASYSVNGEDATVSYEYTPIGQVDLIHYPREDVLNLVVRDHYDSHGNLSSVENAITLEEYWKLEEAHQGQRVAVEKLGNVRTNRGYYEDTGRLASIQSNRISTPLTLQNMTFEWDPTGNLEYLHDSDLPTKHYCYDALDRLTSIQNGELSPTIIAYDDLGNISSSSDIGAYHYESSQPHAVSSAAGRSFFYNGNGNMNRRFGAGINGEQKFNYTAFNLPRTVTDENENELARFDYGAGGQRMLKRSAQGTRFYAGELFESVTSGELGSTVTSTYKIYVGNRRVAEIVASPNETEQHYLLEDHLGSTRAIADETGSLISSAEYGAFGQTMDGTVPSTTSSGFTGHEQDGEVDLINMRGRIYDPQIGRFLTPDPIVQEPFWSQGLNAYSYVFNNPLRYTDPTGFEGQPTGEQGKTTIMETWTAVTNPDGSLATSHVQHSIVSRSSAMQSTQQHASSQAAHASGGAARVNGDPAVAGSNSSVPGTSVGSAANGSAVGVPSNANGWAGVNSGEVLAHFGAGALGGVIGGAAAGVFAGLFPAAATGIVVVGLGLTGVALTMTAIEVVTGKDLFSGQTLTKQDFANRFAETAGGFLGGWAGGAVGKSIGDGIRNSVQALRVGNILGIGLPSIGAARGSGPSSRALGRALETAGNSRSAGSAAHHIVAGSAEAAAPARAVLQRFGIGLNDASNGVFLPKEIHSGIHTNAYYTAVNATLSQATSREEAMQALDAIHQRLLSGSFP